MLAVKSQPAGNMPDAQDNYYNNCQTQSQEETLNGKNSLSLCRLWFLG